MIASKTLIYPLMMHSEGTTFKGNKIKIDIDKFVQDEF